MIKPITTLKSTSYNRIWSIDWYVVLLLKASEIKCISQCRLGQKDNNMETICDRLMAQNSINIVMYIVINLNLALEDNSLHKILPFW